MRRYSVVNLSNGSNLFTGHVSMTGRVGDREGSFDIEDSGMGSPDGASGKWQIVAGSASGELAGLKGSGSWTWEKGSQDVAYSLSYEL